MKFIIDNVKIKYYKSQKEPAACDKNDLFAKIVGKTLNAC